MWAFPLSEEQALRSFLAPPTGVSVASNRAERLPGETDAMAAERRKIYDQLSGMFDPPWFADVLSRCYINVRYLGVTYDPELMEEIDMFT